MNRKAKAVATLWELPTKCGHISHMMIEKTEKEQEPSKEIIKFYLERLCADCLSHNITSTILRRMDV